MAEQNEQQEHIFEEIPISKELKIASAVIVGVVLCLIVWAGVSGSSGTPTSNNETPAAIQEDVQKETKSEVFDMDLSQDAQGLTITSNETETFKGCTIELNETYKEEGQTLLVGDTFIAYGSFVDDDGKRFNPLTHSVEDVMVMMCDGSEDRYATWERQ